MMRWASFVRVGALLAVICLSIMSTAHLFDYYYHFRTIGERLAAMPGVRVISSWKHEDLTLEDFGYAIRVRNCPAIRLDFYETREWQGLFDRIDGVIVWSGDGSRENKILMTKDMNINGHKIGNLTELIADLEYFLQMADKAPSTGTPWPTATGDYVMMRYPADGSMPKIPE